MPARNKGARAEREAIASRLVPMIDIKAKAAHEYYVALDSKRSACRALGVSFHTFQKYLKHAKKMGLK